MKKQTKLVAWKIRPRVTVWHQKGLPSDAKQWSRRMDFTICTENHDLFFFLHALWIPAFDFNVEVAMNESHSYTLAFAILKVDAICDVAMT